MTDETLEPTGWAGLLPAEFARAAGFDQGWRGKQAFQRLASGALTWEDMTGLSLADRERLSPTPLFSSSVSRKLDSADGTVKFQIRLFDGAAVECVLLVDPEGRMTACLSTQVGCPMACAFCKTGTLGFLRNLRTAEIVEQFLYLQSGRERISNIVFMGMGEPLLNLDYLRAAIGILEHPDGLNLSRRKITISTCGLVNGIRDLADSGPHVRLAVSLTSADPALRERLMPVTKANPLPELKAALIHYQEKTGDRVTLEAALLGGENTGAREAAFMADFCRGLKAQVNLIPWNPVEGLPFTEPTRAEVEACEAGLEAAGITVVRRARRGRGVNGACGQLGDTLRDEDGMG